MSIKKLIEELYLYDFAPVSPAADRAVERFCKELDFRTIEIQSGTEKNGWLIPQSWRFNRGEIRLNGSLIYDGRAHPLGVVGYSPSFRATVDLATLKQHLYFSQERPDALVFHCTHFFRPAERDWGFCVPKTLYDSLQEGQYEVLIETEEKPGTLKILEYRLPGKSQETIVLHGHNCHPGQANDDLSGCAAGIELMKRLQNSYSGYYSICLLISPELLGAFYWLDQLREDEARNLKFGIMLKSVGNNAPLRLQRSYFGNTSVDLAAKNALRTRNPNFNEGAFRRVYGNDETLFEAPGYEIPTISLTRYPFPEYHTSHDTPAIISESSLAETVAVLDDIIFSLNHNYRIQRQFKGLLGLSHPKFQLYQPFWNPALKDSPVYGSQNNWHYLMIDMFRDFDSNRSVLEIAERHNLPFREVFNYLGRLRSTGAVEWVKEPLNQLSGI